MAVNPYKKLLKDYNSAQNATYQTQVGSLANTRDSTVAGNNANYDASANKAYVAYMNQLKGQKATASNNGMTGGAVEGMAVNSANGYNSNLATNEGGRMTANTNANNTYSQGVQEAAQTRDTNISNMQAQMGQANIERQDTINANKLNVYADTISRYQSPKSINKAIKYWRGKGSSNPNASAYIAYLQQQQATVKAAAKKKK